MGLRDQDLNRREAQLGSAADDIPGHRERGQDRAVLGHQPLPDPPGDLALLAPSQLIGQQRPVDDRPRGSTAGRDHPIYTFAGYGAAASND